MFYNPGIGADTQCWCQYRSIPRRNAFLFHSKSQITAESFSSSRCIFRNPAVFASFLSTLKFLQSPPPPSSGGGGSLPPEGRHALLRAEQQWRVRAGRWKPFGRSAEAQVAPQHQEGADCHPQDGPQGQQTGGPPLRAQWLIHPNQFDLNIADMWD